MSDKKSFELVLKTPIKVHKAGSGTEVEASLIVFNAPTARVRSQASSLKQGYTQGVMSLQKKYSTEVEYSASESTPTDVEPTGSDLVEMLYASETSIDVMIENLNCLPC